MNEEKSIINYAKSVGHEVIGELTKVMSKANGFVIYTDDADNQYEKLDDAYCIRTTTGNTL